MTYQIVADAAERDLLGEGLLWSVRDGAMYWTDILAPALNRLSMRTGEVTRWPMPEMVGWVIEREHRPGFIAGFRSGFAELTVDPLNITPLVDPEPDRPGNRLNDAKADRWGRIWAGTMPVAMDGPYGALHRLDPDGSVVLVDDGYVVPNGPAFSPDQRWLYHTDTMAGLIYRFALSEAGVDERQEFVRFETGWGLPDGMTVDAQGFIWVAHFGGGRVTRFDPSGRIDRILELPASQVTNVCFAGDGLDRLFATTAAVDKLDEPEAGMLFELDPAGVRGLAPGLFGG